MSKLASTTSRAALSWTRDLRKFESECENALLTCACSDTVVSVSSEQAWFSLSRAAEQCGVSRSTVRRRRESGAFPGAEKRDGEWMIPLSDLLAAGMVPGRVDSPEQVGEPGQSQLSEQGVEPVVSVPLSQWTAVQTRLEVAEARLEERERTVNALEMAVRAIEGPPIAVVDTDESATSDAVVDLRKQRVESKRRWWRRRGGPRSSPNPS